MADSNPLLSLLRECVVRIDVGGSFRGTGFFVAPGEVLTCAHVVHGGGEILVRGSGWESTADVRRQAPDLEANAPEARFYPLPDIALLHVSQAPPSQPCVRTETERPAGGKDADALVLTGFCRGAHEEGAVERSGASVEFEALFEEGGWELFKLKGGQVVGGFSGCPVLNTATGSVCGVIDSSRNEAADLGGFAVPFGAIAEAIPGVVERNLAHHETDPRWSTALDDERAAVAMRRGDADRLPLHFPANEPATGDGLAPSELLKPHHRVVGLINRDELQAQLMRWRESDDRLGVVLLTGGGGFGKTRLALEECRRAELAGWTAGLLTMDASADADTALDRLVGWGGRLFVAVDYAETRPNLVGSLILRLARRRSGPPVRLTLICRHVQVREDIERLFAVGDGRDEIVRALVAAEPVRLDAHPLDGPRLFEAGRAAFGEIVEADAAAAAPLPSLRGEHFARPLFILGAALLSISDPEIEIDSMSRDQLMLELLDGHEAQYWQRWDESLGTGMDSITRRRAVAVATALGAGSEAEALSLVGIVPGLEDASAERRRAVAHWLSHLYGDGRLDQPPAVNPVEPDMLGEALVAREYASSEGLLGATLAAATDRQLARAFAVFARASEGNEELTGQLRRAFDMHLPALVGRAAGGDPELVAGLEHAIRLTLPLAGAAVSISSGKPLEPGLEQLDITLHRLGVAYHRELSEADPGTHLPELARKLHNLATILRDSGQMEEALEPWEESVEQYRKLAEEDPDTHLSELTMALNGLGTALGRLGKDQESLRAFEETVELWRELSGRNPAERPNLAGSLNNLAIALGDLGRGEEALAHSKESVELYRLLEKEGVERASPGLAAALSTLSAQLSELGWQPQALAAAKESVERRRKLAAVDPGAYLPELALALTHLWTRLADDRLALAAIEETVPIFAELARQRPDRYQPELALALSCRAITYRSLGRYDDALDSVGKALGIYLELREERPDSHRPNLAVALNTLALTLHNLERHEQALATGKESAALYRELATQNPGRYLPDAARALQNLSDRFDNLGERGGALAAIEEAVEFRRLLYQQSPARHSAELAQALHTLSLCLRSMRRHEDGLAAVEESAGIYRGLVEEAEEQLPRLAATLNTYAILLHDLERTAAALAASSESVGIYRGLVEKDPQAHLPELAGALQTLAIRLAKAERDEEALAPVEEAIGYRRELLERDGDKHLPHFAACVTILSACLDRLGRPAEALAPVEEALASSGDTAVASTLLLARAAHYHRTGPVEMAVASAWSALEKLEARDPYTERGEIRELLRALRGEDPADFDRAWEAELGIDQPLWLRHHTTDEETVELLLHWVQLAPDWERSRAFLSENSALLLSDVAEAGLEHLLDVNPGRDELTDHLEVLKAARRNGIDDPYARIDRARRLARLREWLAKDVKNSLEFLLDHEAELLDQLCEDALLATALRRPEDTVLLAKAALLSLSRTDTPAAAYELLLEAELVGDDASCLRSPDEPRILSLARLAAGRDRDEPRAHFQHALASVAAGREEEASQAIERCRRLLTSWDRQHYLQRLDDLTEAHSDLVGALRGLKRGLIGPSPDAVGA